MIYPDHVEGFDDRGKHWGRAPGHSQHSGSLFCALAERSRLLLPPWGRRGLLIPQPAGGAVDAQQHDEEDDPSDDSFTGGEDVDASAQTFLDVIGCHNRSEQHVRSGLSPFSVPA